MWPLDRLFITYWPLSCLEFETPGLYHGDISVSPHGLSQPLTGKSKLLLCTFCYVIVI